MRAIALAALSLLASVSAFAAPSVDRIDIVDAEVPEPGGPRAVLPHLIGQAQHTTDIAIGCRDHAIVDVAG